MRTSELFVAKTWKLWCVDTDKSSWEFKTVKNKGERVYYSSFCANVSYERSRIPAKLFNMVQTCLKDQVREKIRLIYCEDTFYGRPLIQLCNF